VKNRGLQEQLFAGEQRRFTLGASTPYNVTQQGRDLMTAQNAVMAELDFGTNQTDKTFVRRADENFFYAVKRGDFERLPSASFQMPSPVPVLETYKR